ncbi:MFS transporter [Paenibacillus sp. PAMC21692]|uniref:MFS transporter n=1 Tax=Paenibacillus sp. PAMC21692 TaxID=2762320 RepID=UPI00164E61F8|nr:MFS transporter [Paenibacillus sp. PAMC21692]QNK59841.1 MFS transporter [Paenibacillus sp. PAMC21692]
MAKLDKQAALLLIVQALYGVANALSGTFVPVYLWKASESYMLIGWFTFAQFVLGGLTFWVAGKWVKEHNKMNSLRVGIALSGVFYCAVLLLGTTAKTWAVPLGALNGIAMGMFWIACNVVYFEVTEPDTRDSYNGWAGLLGSMAGIFAPWISGLLITTMQGEKGYRIIFSLSLAIFAVSVVLSFWLKKRKVEGTYDWLYGFRQLAKKGNSWRRMFLAIMAQGVREGVFMFLVGLTVYIATRDESKLGTYSLITSLIALISFWAAGKWLKPHRRLTGMLIGVVMISLVILPLFWQVSYTTLLLFGIGTSLFMPLYIIPMTSRVFDLIGESRESASHREEFVVLREAGLTLGRMVGLSAYLIVLPITDSPRAITWLMLGVGVVPIAGWWFIRPFLQAQHNNGQEGHKRSRLKGKAKPRTS